tara:strand:- start:328 stop:1263 length:936 start_codon:yes stop_codon:yes gene_type:complete
MTTSFSALKKARTSSFDKLNSQLQKMNQTGNKGDDRFWKPEVDKAGNGYAVIRFLPAPQGEDMPFVRMWDHGFQGPGGWYIENSLTTLSQDDPVSEYNSKLWNSGHDEDKETARKQKRRLNYIANIYVVKDSANPSREGQVYLYKFGKKIFDKLNDAMNPQYDDESPINPFDFWEGADFKLKIRQVEGYRNYDKSEFDKVSVLSGADGAELSDETLEEVWGKQHSLQEIVDPKNFKSYDELKAKLYKVLGLDGSTHAPTVTAEDDNAAMGFTPNFKERSAPESEVTSSPTLASDDGDDESLDFFKSLAEDN